MKIDFEYIAHSLLSKYMLCNILHNMVKRHYNMAQMKQSTPIQKTVIMPPGHRRGQGSVHYRSQRRKPCTGAGFRAERMLRQAGSKPTATVRISPVTRSSCWASAGF